MKEPIDSRQLQIFLRLAQEGSLKKAAESLFLTTSAISHSISNLESDLGVLLFHRSGRGLVLTERGKFLYKKGGVLMAQLCGLRQQMSVENVNDAASLRIAAAHNFVSYLLPEIAREFSECFRRVNLGVRATEREQCLEMLRLREVDAAVVVDPPEDNSDFMHSRLFVDRFVLVMSARNPLAGMERVPWRSLMDRTLVLARMGSYTSKLLLEESRRRGIRFGDHMEVGSAQAALEMLKIGGGVSLLPSWVVAREASPTIVTRPIEGFNLERVWGFVVNRSDADSLCMRTFRRLCQRQAELMDVAASPDTLLAS